MRYALAYPGSGGWERRLPFVGVYTPTRKLGRGFSQSGETLRRDSVGEREEAKDYGAWLAPAYDLQARTEKTALARNDGFQFIGVKPQPSTTWTHVNFH